MHSSKSKGKQKGLAEHAGYASSSGSNGNGSNSIKGTTNKPNLQRASGLFERLSLPLLKIKGIMDSSKSNGKQKGLADKAGYASSSGGNGNGSKGSNSTKGTTKQPNLGDWSGYASAKAPPPPTQ